jgi:hypothetical protein
MGSSEGAGASSSSNRKSEAKRERHHAQDAIDTLVRTQIARGLAPLFLERARPYEDNADLSALIEHHLLHKAAFIQKPPFLLKFYKRLLFAMDRAPRSILEVMAFFAHRRKAPFPDASIGARLALDVAPLADDLIVARRVLALRIGEG